MWLNDTPIVSLRPKAGGGINIYNIHTDHLNTPRLITGSVNPGVRWRWDGDPFGAGGVNNNPSGVGAFNFDLRLPGQIAMAETGLYYNLYRDYDASIGRYVESDPIGLDGGINTYLYAGANPVANIDPLGLFNVRAYETADPANGSYVWRYEFSFGSCAQGVADMFGPRLFPPAVRRLIGGLGKIRPDPAGDVDISSFMLRCRCQQYDRELKQTFDEQFGGSHTYSQSDAQQAVQALKRKLKQLEGDCPECVAAYNWNNILPTAVERGVKAIRRVRPGG